MAQAAWAEAFATRSNPSVTQNLPPKYRTTPGRRFKPVWSLTLMNPEIH
jgi:hypothetical protein